MENDILTQWSNDAIDIIHDSTSKYLLIRTEKGLIDTNFDANVSAYRLAISNYRCIYI